MHTTDIPALKKYSCISSFDHYVEALDYLHAHLFKNAYLQVFIMLAVNKISYKINILDKLKLF